MSSRLGEPAPQPKSGAGRFATPILNQNDAQASKRPSVKTAKRQSVKASKLPSVKTSKRQSAKPSKIEKQPVTVRLTADAIDLLAEIERGLRRAGVKARRASTSEIVETLIRATTPKTVHDLIGLDD